MGSDTMKTYTIKGTLVKDHIHKRSYNMTSKVDAELLHQTLTQYETKITEQQAEIQTNTNLHKIRQQLIALQMDITQIQNDLDKIKELIQ